MMSVYWSRFFHNFLGLSNIWDFENPLNCVDYGPHIIFYGYYVYTDWALGLGKHSRNGYVGSGVAMAQYLF